MISYNELKPGTVFVWKGEPWNVLEYNFLRMQQRKPVAKTKIKNLKNGKVLDQTFHFGDEFEEAEVTREPVKFIYASRGDYWFNKPSDPSQRFALKDDVIGPTVKFLKPDSEVTAVKFADQIISIDLPIKLELEVKEAPPALRGNTAQGGSKPVTLETGAVISVPMFISTGDIIRVNTQTGEYAERVEKAK
jgi:elongation factor P